uniref:E3 ubiquitin-protein ligase PPP1R11 n=1 Tax=Phallusia mammillata TaxID=59560 RepID=A0A6F9DQ14_9ASCI|nr:protein phosphatase 1 regulatory subunit 11-like [Phallusia mammillata]
MTTTECSSETRTETQTLPQTNQVCLVHQQTNRGVTWSAGTVDNENMGKKSSKCCCIYHKPRVMGESSSETDSDSDDLNPYEKTSKKKKCSKHKHDLEPSKKIEITKSP